MTNFPAWTLSSTHTLSASAIRRTWTDHTHSNCANKGTLLGSKWWSEPAVRSRRTPDYNWIHTQTPKSTTHTLPRHSTGMHSSALLRRLAWSTGGRVWNVTRPLQPTGLGRAIPVLLSIRISLGRGTDTSLASRRRCARQFSGISRADCKPEERGHRRASSTAPSDCAP